MRNLILAALLLVAIDTNGTEAKRLKPLTRCIEVDALASDAGRPSKVVCPPKTKRR